MDNMKGHQVEKQESTKKGRVCQVWLSPSTLAVILKQGDQFVKEFVSGACGIKCKGLNQAEFSDVDEALMLWFVNAHAHSVPVSKKAHENALGHHTFGASNGWVWHFKTARTSSKWQQEAEVLEQAQVDWGHYHYHSCEQYSTLNGVLMQTKQGSSIGFNLDLIESFP